MKTLVTFLEQLFGANWRTTITGTLSVLAFTIAQNPHLVDFLPESIRGHVVGISGLIAALSGVAFAAAAKDRKVTGGSVQQPDPIAKRFVPVLALLLVPVWLTGCAETRYDVAAKWRVQDGLTLEAGYDGKTVRGAVVVNGTDRTSKTNGGYAK